MKQLAYILIFVFSSSAFAGLPKIKKHTKLVFKAPSGAKVLYRAKFAKKSRSGLSIKWFVDGKKKCEKRNCIIKAGYTVGQKKKVYLLVTNKNGSSFVRFSLETSEGTAKKEIYRPRMIDFKDSDSEARINKNYIVSLGAKGYAYTNEELKVVRKKVRNLGKSDRLRAGRSPLKFGEVSEFEYYLLSKSKIELIRKKDFTIYKLKKGGIRYRGLNYQSQHSPFIQVSDFNIIAPSQSDFIVKYDKKDDYFKVYVLAGEIDLYQVSTGDLDPWISVEAGNYIKVFKNAEGFTSEIHEKIETRWLGVIKNTTPDLLNRSHDFETNPYNSTGHINLSEDNPQFSYYKNFSMIRLDKLVQIKKSKRDSGWYSDIGRVFYELKWKRAAIRAFKKSIKMDQDNTLPYFYLGNIAFDDKNFEIAKDRYLKVESSDDIVYTLSSRLGQIYEAEKDYHNAEKNYAICYDNAVSKEEEVWALKRLTEVRQHLKWDIEAGLGLGYDSNIFRSSNDFLPTDAEDVNASAGYKLNLVLAYKFINLAEDELSIRYTFDYEGWTDPALSNYSLSHQTFYISWFKDIYKQLEIAVGAESYGIGSNRALDGLAGKIHYEAPMHFGLFLGGSFLWAIDPLPDLDDGFDPLLHQTVEISDRSSRILEFDLGFLDLYGSYLKLNYLTRDFTSSFSTDQNYVSASADLGYQLDLENWFMSADITYQNLNFSESPESREDSIYGVESKINYKLAWGLLTGLNIGYESSNSTVSDYSYSRIYGYANMSWAY